MNVRSTGIAAALLAAVMLAPAPALTQAGAASCDPGLVQRNAYPGDLLCVTEAAHDQAVADNALAPSRSKPDGSCLPGFVWREANSSDHVCVLPATRAQTRADNKQATRTTAPRPAPSQTTMQRTVTNPFLGISGSRELLIIAPDEFIAALEPLVAHKYSTGMSTLAVSIAQLTSNFPGVDDPEKIKRGIQFAHEHLSTKYVMLVGDAHWFPVRYMFMKNLSRYYPNRSGPEILPLEGVYIATDLYYANLYHHQIAQSRVAQSGLDVSPGPFDDWNANRDGYYNEMTWLDGTNPNPDKVDGYPDVAIARAIAHSAADVTTYVNKIIRYETQKPQESLFTFVADGFYEGAPGLVDSILAKSHLNSSSAYLQINKPDPHASARWVANASPADVALKINSSVWVGYLGHGSPKGWDGPGFDLNVVKLAANNGALPVVFTDGCSTGRFAIEPPFDFEYVDVAGNRHNFTIAPGAAPDKPSVPVFIDKVSGQSWGTNCAGCNPTPLIAPMPNAYDFDRSVPNFAYPWLFGDPQGGAIAYFGETEVMEPQMAAELETYMLMQYALGQRNLGAIYLQAERQYWAGHRGDAGNIDFHSIARFYLGLMVMFGDPSLRMH